MVAPMVRFVTDNSPEAPKPRRRRTAAQIEAQAELDAARARDAARRRDTRRKVVIGGALIALAERDDEAAQMLARLKRSLSRPADRKLFEDE